MKPITKFTAITEDQLKGLSSELKGIISDDELELFTDYVKPFEKFGDSQLDNIFLVAELTIKGSGKIEKIEACCSVNQEDWVSCEDEADIRIDAVNIPLKVLLPPVPFDVSGAQTFLVVLQAEGNMWDSCKELPSWIWNERKFEFMLTFELTTTDGKVHSGNYGDEYANTLISF